MPRLDGQAATRELRRRGCRLPIIALTASSSPEERAECLAAGCTAHLAKPIDRGVLLDALAQFLAPGRPATVMATPEPAVRQAPLEPERLRSTFADDPAMTEALAAFVETLPERVARMRALLSTGRLSDLQRVVHQIKGAGGGYGFDAITRFAAVADASLKEQAALPTVTRQVELLVALIRSVEGYQSFTRTIPWLTRFWSSTIRPRSTRWSRCGSAQEDVVIHSGLRRARPAWRPPASGSPT